MVELAQRQHGVIARSQLLDLGYSKVGIRRRLEKGRIHEIHRAVYAVGHRLLTREGRWMGAVLAAGRGAAGSHRMAAAIWGFWRSDWLEVTAPSYRVRPGIQIHTSSLPGDELTTSRGIPVTCVSRTLLDLAAVLRPHHLERAVHELEVQRLTDNLSLPEVLTRNPRRPGARALRRILGAGASPTRSELEARFLGFVRANGYSGPETNVLVQGFECDCVWREQRVIVELDSRSVHDTRSAFERDRTRDRALQAAGWRVIRVTWRQLHGEAEALAGDLRTILRARPPRRRGRARGGGP